ncbi:translocation/assembly module TamB domain-containing protein [Undibacterium umbellatum]|uniref:Translocation/assembly module TamB domain-containing protein n=1 Tax=Undibacterium umbellatum TaxID=2762300 RepID=A0ABR6ZJD4_9BURK|nr:translocation/assembly module TamB domain-containing protein [Undibacterium umbellatum]MBC3911357.1 translocation/assembly module TamB domain-containing protein [Undibacterium umbellatum]
MSANDKDQVEKKLPAKKKRRPLRRLSWFTAKLFLLLIFVSGLVLTWMYKTESGTKTALSMLEKLSVGSLKFSGVQGTLDDELKLDEFSFISQDLHVKGSAVILQWRPTALWRRHIDITSLQLIALTVATRSSESAASIPVDIGLPFSLNAPRLALGRLHIASLMDGGKQVETLQLSGLTGSFSYQDKQFKAQTILTSPWGKLTGNADLGSLAPFKLNSRLSLQGKLQEGIPPVTLQGVVSGSLHDMQVALEAALDSATDKTIKNQHLQGHAKARISAFTAPYVRELDIDVQHLDPSAWQAGAPQADLRILTQLKPVSADKKKNPEFGLTGPITIHNAQAASINKQGLPVQSLSTKLFWQGQHLSLKDLAVQLAGKGKLHGEADINWQAADLQADLKLNLVNIDLNQIDQRLHASNIQGKFFAQTAKDKSIKLQAKLQDARASLNAEASYQHEKLLLKLDKIDLQAEDAHLQGTGDISFAGKQVFNLKASLKDFDPARWVATPAGRLQADFSAHGQLLPRLDVQANLQQLQGQYAGQAVQAGMDMRWLQDQQLQVKQLDLRFGKNTLTGQGNWGSADDILKLNIDAQDLSHLNPLLSNWQLALGGNLKADATLRGRFNQPAGSLDALAKQVIIKRGNQQISIAELKSRLNLANGIKGQFEGEIVASHIASEVPASSNATNTSVSAAVNHKPDKIEQVILKLQGRRDAHKLSLETIFPNKQTLSLAASGSMQADAKNDAAWSWNGQLQALNLNGQPDLRLQSSASLQVSAQAVRLGSLSLQSAMGKLQLDELEWTPAALKTSGQVSDVQVVEITNLFYPQHAVSGNLKLNAQWKLQLKESAQGEIKLQRQSGDLRFNDPEGTGTSVALGIRAVQLQMKLGGLVAGSAGENVSLDLVADGSRLGQWQVKANTQLSKQNDAWTILASAPLSGQITAAVPDLQWLGPFINPGVVLKGKLNADARLSGSIGKPGYRATLAGREMEIAFASEGLLLPNGSFDAQIEDKHLKVTNLQFSNTVTNMPRHAQFQGVNWIGRKGEFKASGDIDIGKETGSIQAQWTQFPLLQRKDRWLVVSGEANIVETNNIWSLTGKVLADGAYFRLPKLPPPSLSSDVVVIRKTDKAVAKAAEADSNRKSLKTRVDVSFDMGPRFVFVGRGLDTGLEGSLRLRSIDGSPLQANGSIRTLKGVYEGYGQQLEIERGILNFQGPPSNPGLNIRALRKGLPIEAGVEVFGTVSAPQVRLVSEPDVPDAEKLSWLVLGRGSDQLASGDASLLMSAATAIFGGDGSRNVPRDIVQGLGFDEFSIGSSSNGSSSRLPGQTIAGSTGTSNATTDQVVSVGKRLMPGLVLSVERGLSDASGGIKLSWQLTRRISIIGRAGNESAVDVNYTFSFN